MNTNKYRKMPTGYGMVQTAVMRLDDLSIQAKAVYSLLCSYTGSNELCFPSMATIAKDLNFKSRKSSQKYLAELEKHGLIQRGKLYPNDPLKTHNTYRVMYIEETNISKNESKYNSRWASQYPSGSTVMPIDRAPQYPYNNNIFNNTINESTPPEGELTPPTEEKTPLRAKNDKISDLLKNQKNTKNEWFLVPDKLEYEFNDSEHVKLLNKPDGELTAMIPAFLADNGKREALETDIDIFFRFARKEKVSTSLINKIKNIDYILDKFDYKQYLKGFELAQARGKENKLSYLRKVLEKSFMPKIHSQTLQMKLEI